MKNCSELAKELVDDINRTFNQTGCDNSFIKASMKNETYQDLESHAFRDLSKLSEGYSDEQPMDAGPGLIDTDKIDATYLETSGSLGSNPNPNAILEVVGKNIGIGYHTMMDTITVSASNPVGTAHLYFTPEISDIRVGYECEIRSHSIADKKLMEWKKDVFKIQYTLPMLQLIIEQSMIRVPYLTKEQIEAEGWKSINENNRWFQKSSYTIYYNHDSHFMDIGGKFLGQCKDINTFRYITKLLGI